jgi:hypothetical protein
MKTLQTPTHLLRIHFLLTSDTLEVKSGRAGSSQVGSASVESGLIGSGRAGSSRVGSGRVCGQGPVE